MKITAVETYLLRVPVDPCTYGASSKGWIRDRSPLRDDLSFQPIRIEDGFVRVPRGPGLGITINLEVLGQHHVA